jgi:hypothetical protein
MHQPPQPAEYTALNFMSWVEDSFRGRALRIEGIDHMRASILLMVPTPQEERTMLYTQKNNAQKLLHAIICSSSIHWQIIGNL